MLKIAHAIYTVHAEMCDADCFPHFVTADELRGGLFSLKMTSCSLFLEKILIPTMS